MSATRYQRIVYSLTFFALCGIASCTSPLKETTAKGRDSSQPHERFRILGAFSHPGKSHFDVFRPLLEELARRGHNVTVVSYFPRDNRTSPLPNYRDISLLSESAGVFLNVVDLHMIQHSPLRVLQELLMLQFWGLDSCEVGVNNPGVKELIKSDEEFDVILTEGFNSDCFLGFVHRFKAPSISLSSHQMMPWVSERFANEDNPSYVPTIFLGLEPKMNFFERLTNAFWLPFAKTFYEYAYNIPMQRIVEKAFGPGVPPLREIAKNTSAVLVNTHFSLHGSKPDLPSIIEVGGLHISPIVKPLPADLQKFLDDSHEGVLYFSLGSMIKAATMPKDKLTAVLNVIRSIPRRVIWKWENEDLPNKPSNLLVRKWLPQAAILKHPKVMVYMAHGGMLGVSEGVHAGVPMVIIPMFGDQFHNAAAAKSRGVAEVLNWVEFDEKTLRLALDRVFNDTSYGVNARALSKAYRDRPSSPLETAVWWTEYIARGNGNPYLKSAAHDLTWYQYYLLDVVLFAFVVAIVGIYATVRIFKFFVSLIRKQRSVSTTNGSIPSRKKTTKRE